MDGALHIFGWHLTGYRRVWRSSVFSSFLLPVIFLAGIGLGVGTFVNRSHQLGVDYLSYLAPGVLASTVLGVAMGESTYTVYAHFEWTRVYHAVLATPVRIVELVAGQLLFVVFRCLLAVVIFLAVMAAFGTIHSPWAVAVLPTTVLLTLACATPMFAFTARQHSETSFSVLHRFAIVPAQLFGGVFFPVSQLPAVVRPVAYLSPLWHGVELCRGFSLGTPSPLSTLGHAGYLAGWAVLGFLLACRTFRRRLIN